MDDAPAEFQTQIFCARRRRIFGQNRGREMERRASRLLLAGKEGILVEARRLPGLRFSGVERRRASVRSHARRASRGTQPRETALLRILGRIGRLRNFNGVGRVSERDGTTVSGEMESRPEKKEKGMALAAPKPTKSVAPSTLRRGLFEGRRRFGAARVTPTLASVDVKRSFDHDLDDQRGVRRRFDDDLAVDELRFERTRRNSIGIV